MLRAPVVAVALALLAVPAAGFSPALVSHGSLQGAATRPLCRGTAVPSRELPQHKLASSRGARPLQAFSQLPWNGAARAHRAGRGLGPLRMLAGDMDDMPGKDEQHVERMVERLETNLEASVEEEQYQQASKIRDELSRMHMDDASSVIQANSDFYKAFSNKDVDMMGKVWRNNQHVQCIHPGAKPLVGYESIVDMWKSMFQARDQVFRSLDISPCDVKVSVRGTTAFVMCTEQVSAPGTQRKMFATNIYRKV